MFQFFGFLLLAALVACHDKPEPEVEESANLDTDVSEVMTDSRLKVEVHKWVGPEPNETEVTCGDAPCLDYELSLELVEGDTKPLAQHQSYPVFIRWESEVPVTVKFITPATALSGKHFSLRPRSFGEEYFNLPGNLTVEFCTEDQGCETKVVFTPETFEDRDDCVSQIVNDIYAPDPLWTRAQAEAYGVSNVPEHCTNYLCTEEAPFPACELGLPNTEECTERGCDCGLNEAWSSDAETKEVNYSPATSVARGVRAPLFADIWEVSYLVATLDGNTTFLMSAEVNLSADGLIYRPVMDERTGWNGNYDYIPDPNGHEGPPLFHNPINDSIGPASGYWPVSWEVKFTEVGPEVWGLAVHNVIVPEGADDGQARLKDPTFQVCGSTIRTTSCDEYGCN